MEKVIKRFLVKLRYYSECGNKNKGFHISRNVIYSYVNIYVKTKSKGFPRSCSGKWDSGPSDNCGHLSRVSRNTYHQSQFVFYRHMRWWVMSRFLLTHCVDNWCPCHTQCMAPLENYALNGCVHSLCVWHIHAVKILWECHPWYELPQETQARVATHTAISFGMDK